MTKFWILISLRKQCFSCSQLHEPGFISLRHVFPTRVISSFSINQLMYRYRYSSKSQSNQCLHDEFKPRMHWEANRVYPGLEVGGLSQLLARVGSCNHIHCKHLQSFILKKLYSYSRFLYRMYSMCNKICWSERALTSLQTSYCSWTHKLRPWCINQAHSAHTKDILRSAKLR